MSTTTAEVVRLEDRADGTEAIALAGFLAGYCGATARAMPALRVELGTVT